eukprot:759402-Hanusia_phi.AAC.1
MLPGRGDDTDLAAPSLLVVDNCAYKNLPLARTAVSRQSSPRNVAVAGTLCLHCGMQMARRMQRLPDFVLSAKPGRGGRSHGRPAGGPSELPSLVRD